VDGTGSESCLIAGFGINGGAAPLGSATIVLVSANISDKKRAAIGYRLDERGSVPTTGSDGIFFSSPPRPDRLWVPPNLLSNG
jgi:hypothetical protein